MLMLMVAEVLLGVLVLVRLPGVAELVVLVPVSFSVALLRLVPVGMAVLVQMVVAVGVGVGVAVGHLPMAMGVGMHVAVLMGVVMLVLVPAGIVVLVPAVHGKLRDPRLAAGSLLRGAENRNDLGFLFA